MSATTLAAETVAILAPVLPFLTTATNAAAKTVGSSAAGALWARLFPKIQGDPVAKAAADKVAAQPGDATARKVLELSLAELLKDADLAAAVRAILGESGNRVIVTGDGNVTAGRDISGNVIMTGKPTPRGR